jgi:hypothetical protein
MPSHLSHLLQPLNVVPYSLLKRYYGDEISLLARSRVYHISKEAFLPAFKAAFNKTFTQENVRAGFRGAGLVPYDPDAVLSKLDVQLRTVFAQQPSHIAGRATLTTSDDYQNEAVELHTIAKITRKVSSLVYRAKQ